MLFSCQKEYDPGDYGFVTDGRDGKAYYTVRIGSQTWLAENLKYLPEVSTPVQFSDTLKFYYVYDYYGARVDRAQQTIDYNTYGVLYNFSAALHACPQGWRLPDEADWEVLRSTVGIENGVELRSRTLWVSTEKGKNSTGFNALPAGCQESGKFKLLGEKASFWSSKRSEDYPGKAYTWGFHNNLDIFESDTSSRANAFPVRCIME